MDELGSLNRAELGSLKELITEPSIRLRSPYGFNTENMLRRSSFIGLVNSKEFLNDSTGNRRFLCFEATIIDNLHNIPIDAVYA
jgi:predicted P-loop ATPase